jgi:hypothetical protein
MSIISERTTAVYASVSPSRSQTRWADLNLLVEADGAMVVGFAVGIGVERAWRIIA